MTICERYIVVSSHTLTPQGLFMVIHLSAFQCPSHKVNLFRKVCQWRGLKTGAQCNYLTKYCELTPSAAIFYFLRSSIWRSIVHC